MTPFNPRFSMHELRRDGLLPQISLQAHEASNVLNILRFRLRCIRERKTGAVMLPFGQAYYIDANGNYLDGKLTPGEAELSAILTELKEATTDIQNDVKSVKEKGNG
jgi:hypothetical protein